MKNKDIVTPKNAFCLDFVFIGREQTSDECTT